MVAAAHDQRGSVMKADARSANDTYQVSIDHLEQLRSGGPWAVLAFDPDRGPIDVGTANDADAVRNFVSEHNGRDNLYYSVNPLRQPMSKKAAKTDIARIEYLLADLDPDDDKGERPEAAKARYLKALAEYERPATATIDSGNGIQALWRLKEPIDISQFEPVWDKKEKKFVLAPEAQKIVADVEARSKAIMIALGAPEADTFNIDRILRLPGTTNLPNKSKRKKGRVKCESKLLSFNGVAYALDDFPAPEPEPASSSDDGGSADFPPMLRSLLYIADPGAGNAAGGYLSRNHLMFAFIIGALALG
jgi:hypothetical protein